MKQLLLSTYRVRLLTYYLSAVLLVAGATIGPLLPWEPFRQVLRVLSLAGLVGLAAAVLLVLVGARLLPLQQPIVVRAPVTGTWLAMNSPATKVPSHGVRAYGQAYAIDLAYEPERGARPAFGSGSAMRAATAYPAFGQPVRAMVDGVVIKASDRQRDHRARSSMLALGYLMVEGMGREIGGPRFIVGNHVVIRTSSGDYALVAHLKRGSAVVDVGEAVTAGQQLAECGNSGNSSEPHVHAQLMDRASLWTAQGIPFAFAGIRIGDDRDASDGVPGTEQHLTAG